MLDKLILEFDQVFWDKDYDWFNFVAENPGEWAQTLNYYKYSGLP